MSRWLALAALAASASALRPTKAKPAQPAAAARRAGPAPLHTAPAAVSAAVATAALPLAASAAVAPPVSSALDPALFLIQFVMLLRVILSWYPEQDPNAMPWRIVTWPTEPVLRATREVVPPSFGVDISPIVWIALASFIREILLGQQGVLVLMMQRG